MSSVKIQNGTISADKIEYNNSPVSLLTNNIDWSLGDLFSKSLDGNTTLTFSNKKIGSIILIVTHHASLTYTLTFPSAYLINIAGETATPFSLSGGTKKTMFQIFYDGTSLYITENPFYLVV